MKCEICGKNHQKLIKQKVKVENKIFEIQIIKSPCLDEILKKASSLISPDRKAG